MTPDQLQRQWAAFAAQAEAHLSTLLSPRPDLPDAFLPVLRYSVLGGGKRIRPVLCMAAAQAAGAPPTHGLTPGCAIELIHAYSLVHDDLPSMDNDDERRGQPTVHRKFDEPTAILAGDGLQAEAFILLADPAQFPPQTPPSTQLAIIAQVAHAAGNAGMVGGQFLDIQARTTPLDLPALRTLHRLKTGALIRAACVCGGLAAQADADALQALTTYGAAVGQIFQLTDDLLDFRAAQVDAEEAAVNFAAILGEPDIQQEINLQLDAALLAASHFSPNDDFLRAFATAMATRLQ
jgi:geranylgeranyl diphosphate synthase type II